MIHHRYPILARIVLFQILITSLGLGGLYTAQWYARVLTWRAEVSRLKEVIRPTLLDRHEQWRAWTYLDVRSPVELELKDVQHRFGLRQLKIAPRSALPANLSSTQVVVPETVEDPGDLVVYAELEPAQAHTANDTWTFVTLLAFFALVLIINFGVGRYIYLQIYKPMLTLGRLLSAPEPFDDQINGVRARGEMATVVESVRQIMDRVRAREKDLALAEIAAQVSHDIRSPLTALELVSGQMAELGESKRSLIRAAVTRIKDIADTLARGQEAPERVVARQDCALSPLLEGIVSEKRIEHAAKTNLTLDLALVHQATAFAAIDPIEFSRLLSNLINNAIESLGERPRVEVKMTSAADRITIEVSDTGCGIDANVLPQLGQRGFTQGKRGGQGLGLFHAKSTIEAWGGTFAIDSERFVGTTVRLTLPAVEPPTWAVSDLRLPPGGRLVIVDDDESVHHVWLERLRIQNITPERVPVHRFANLADFSEWLWACEPSERRALTIVIDHEFAGCRQTGLDAIERLQIVSQAVLVTARANEASVIQRCRAQGIKLLPKSMAPHVPIHVV